MNDFSDLEAELKQLRPAAASPELMTRTERRLAEAPAPDALRSRGAQAASLPFAAACRKHLLRWRARSKHPPGKLPGGAGWQPALPLGLGLAAAAALLLFARVVTDQSAVKQSPIAALTPGPAVQPVSTFVADGVTRVVYRTRDEGLIYPVDASEPVRRVRSRARETLQWKNPGTGASLRVSYPTEEVEFIPIARQ